MSSAENESISPSLACDACEQYQEFKMRYMLGLKKQNCCFCSHGSLPRRRYWSRLTRCEALRKSGREAMVLQFLALLVCNIVDLAAQIKDVSYVRGGHSRYVWVGLCRWERGTPDALQNMFNCNCATLYQAPKISVLSQTNYEPEPLTFTAL